ncbi:hypothetical protein Z951_32465 [Streptomyces sp. PRh5]|nr:hypothetical protein Z951_32465 [Streptomyces sp. PRh5]
MLINLRTESKGYSATRGATASSASTSRPAFAAATSNAPSVVSPRTRQPSRPDGGTSRALQHSAAARRTASTASGSETAPTGAYPTPETMCATPPAHTWATVISARVSVPVLSVHTTLVDPSVSTASSCLMSACRRAMRRTPMASETDKVAGSPSGTSATITPSAKTNEETSPCPVGRRTAKSTAPVASAAPATRRAIEATWS